VWALCGQIDYQWKNTDMSWKVWTFKRTDRPRYETFESREAAFHRACDLLHIVLRIEGPNGERIAIAEIEKWCRGSRTRT
jgi:hypothetical protein